MSTNLFEIASRKAFRFPSVRGDLTVEQLWALPLQSKANFDLDSVAKAINAEVKKTAEESFVTASSSASTEWTQKLDLVKYIIGVRLKENEAARKRADTAAEVAKLTEILGKKKDQALEGLTPEQIQERIQQLQAGG